MDTSLPFDDAPTTEGGFALGDVVVGGRFRVGERLSWGGMGTVYRALDLETGREVAIKLPHIGAPGVTETRFEREVRAVASLVCTSVIGYVGHGSEDEPFLAMELVVGDPLVTFLQEGPLDERASLHVALRLASALAAIHLGGWVHRDVKPGNLVVGPRGAIKLLDFGLSRTLDHAGGSTTAQGDLVGTLGYMAPEQLRGQPIVDARTDVFSLGVVLFECLTGRRAYKRSLATIAKQTPEPPLEVRDAFIRDDLAAVIESMVSHDPGARPADGVEALARLLWLGAPSLAQASFAPVRATLHHALRSGSVSLHGRFAGSATAPAEASAALLAEVMAPSDVVVLACDPSYTTVPNSHATALARAFVQRGFCSLARWLEDARRDDEGPSGRSTGVDPERRVVVVLEDAVWCDPLSASLLQRLAADRSISLIVSTFAQSQREPTLLPGWPIVHVEDELSGAPSFASLSPLGRWVLRAAAMFGRAIPTEGVMALIDGREALDVPAVLDHLALRGFIRPKSPGEFSFTSSVVLDAARALSSAGETRLGTALVLAHRASREPDASPSAVWSMASEECHPELVRANGGSR